ncbi:MAG: ABC transporter permease [Planctomycetales bacterium]|nr:ABC transporter permease [Planctomycetales bacterium]
MTLVHIAARSIRQRALASSLTALSVALGVALMVTVLVINGVVTRMFSQSATGYDLVLGAKGSAMQLVLNTVYFMDRPIENLPYKFYLKVKSNSAVEYAIPFALGDTTSDARFRIVGTIPEFFDVEYLPGSGKRPGKKFQFDSGTVLAEPFDAVIGARVARAYGWKVGDEFPVAHAGNVEDIHAERFKVVGVLAPTGTPNDRAVFVHLQGFYHIPGHEKPKAEADQKAKVLRGEVDGDLLKPAEAFATKNAQDSATTTSESGELPDDQKEVTAILVRMKRLALGPIFQSTVNKGITAQAANPLAEIMKLLRNVVGNIRTILVVMTCLIIIVSGVSIFVSIYNSMSDRRKEIAVMRALGARRSTVLSIILAESILLCLAGGVLGLVLGHGLVFVASPIVEARSDLLIDPWSFEWIELILLPVLIVLASLVGLLPGLTAYRTDVAKSLVE